MSPGSNPPQTLAELTELLSSNNNFSNYRKVYHQCTGFKIPILYVLAQALHYKDSNLYFWIFLILLYFLACRYFSLICSVFEMLIVFFVNLSVFETLILIFSIPQWCPSEGSHLTAHSITWSGWWEFVELP